MSGPSKLRHPVAAKHHASASPNWPCFRFDEQPRSATNPTSATSPRADVGPTVDRHCPSVSAQGPPVPIIAFFMQSSYKESEVGKQLPGEEHHRAVLPPGMTRP